MNESNFDMYIRDLLREAGIQADYQHTEILQLQEALAAASKNQTGEHGKPDFIAVVNEYALVIEDKKDRDKVCLREKDGSISQTVEAVKNYAVNGAVWYARKILEHGAYTKIFAFGNAGDSKHHTMQPVFVGLDCVKELDGIEGFENFSPANIERYYRYEVRGETPPEEARRSRIKEKAITLHEYLRNYGNLSVTEKPLVVSAILLALREKGNGFSLDSLTGDNSPDSYDGAKIYEAVSRSLTHASVSPDVKKQRILDQFAFIKNRPILNTAREEWKDGRNPNGKTPMKFFAEFIDREIYRDIDASSDDVIGIFYMEFIKYTGGDSQSLGVVITPAHITKLFCDLVNLRTDDVILDPCCGTGGFLIAGMHSMLAAAKKESQRRNIKAKQIHGIELRDDMFAMATTSMILHGDGQSNIVCEDFLATTPSETQLKGITIGFMNPPYSQAKSKDTANLSELSFTKHLLDSVLPGGRVAVIVPVSAMIGKTKEDRQLKADILARHTLEGVISLNKNTFYGVGTVPCIAVFTAWESHPKEKLSRFVNFEDDGYIVKMHVGELTETERAKDRRQYLLDCWRGERRDYPSKFMVETQVEAGDEWLHSFYYYNDELPDEAAFSESMGDYLTFEANMIFHGRGYLFGNGDSETDGGDEHT